MRGAGRGRFEQGGVPRRRGVMGGRSLTHGPMSNDPAGHASSELDARCYVSSTCVTGLPRAVWWSIQRWRRSPPARRSPSRRRAATTRFSSFFFLPRAFGARWRRVEHARTTGLGPLPHAPNRYPSACDPDAGGLDQDLGRGGAGGEGGEAKPSGCVTTRETGGSIGLLRRGADRLELSPGV